MTAVQPLRNASSGAVIAGRVRRASNFVSRGIGLLPKKYVAADEGLWIDGCSAIHTMFMRASIDILFLDSEGTVLRIVCGARPNRLAITCPNSVTVVELGAAEARDVLVGDRLTLG